MRYAFLILAGTAFMATCGGATHQLITMIVAGLLSALLFLRHKKDSDDTNTR